MSEYTPEEKRRQDACFFIMKDRNHNITDLSLVKAEDAYDRLLEHFGKSEPEVADAIRYGMRPDDRCEDFRLWRINTSENES